MSAHWAAESQARRTCLSEDFADSAGGSTSKGELGEKCKKREGTGEEQEQELGKKTAVGCVERPGSGVHHPRNQLHVPS